MSSGGDTFLYGGHSVHVAVAEFHDSVINCLAFQISPPSIRFI